MDDPTRSTGVEERCERLEYPVMRADAAAAFADVTVEVDGAETNLGVAISESERDSFANAEELYVELEAAVGEPL
jgi:hypothetical protein